jgi:hypothetical protein
MNRRLNRSLQKAAADAAESAVHCGVTIAARMPVFAGCLVQPSPEAFAEWNRACSEKMAAGFEGAVAASAAWQRMLIASFFRPPTAAAFGHEALRVTEAALRPGRRRAKANARRLTRGK